MVERGLDVSAMVDRCRARLRVFVASFGGPTLDDLRRSARSWSARAVTFPV
jgi:hypothetical protein